MYGRKEMKIWVSLLPNCRSWKPFSKSMAAACPTDTQTNQLRTHNGKGPTGQQINGTKELYTYIHISCFIFHIFIFHITFYVMYICIYVYMYICVCLCVYMYICIYVYICTCIYVYIYIYIYVYMHVCGHRIVPSAFVALFCEAH
jgi:hypothetical protein